MCQVIITISTVPATGYIFKNLQKNPVTRNVNKSLTMLWAVCMHSSTSELNANLNLIEISGSHV